MWNRTKTNVVILSWREIKFDQRENNKNLESIKTRSQKRSARIEGKQIDEIGTMMSNICQCMFNSIALNSTSIQVSLNSFSFLLLKLQYDQ